MSPRIKRAFFVALALAASCAGPGASNDTGTDGGFDAGFDTGAPDTGPRDGGSNDPEWVSIAEGLPSFCPVERANHPERLDDLRVRMSPCSARDNCLVSDPIPGFRSGWPVWLSVDGTYALAVANRGDGWSWLFASPLDGGPPLAVYRGSDDPTCGIAFGALGGGRLAMATSYRQGATAGASFFLAPIADAGHIERAFFDDHTDFAASFIQGLWVTESTLVIWSSGGFFADVSTGALVPVFDSARPGLVYDSASVFGDHVLVEAFDSPSYMVLGQAGVRGGGAYYRAAPGIDVQQPLADGTDIAWLEMPTGSTAGVLELWTAPFVLDPTALAPRHVGTIHTWRHPRIGAGTWTDIAVTPYRIEIYDLADGRRRTYEMPDEIVTQETLFVSGDRVIYPSGARLVQFDPRLVPYDAAVDAGSAPDAGSDGG